MVRQAGKEDAFELARLAIQMWEDNEIEELAKHFEGLVADEEAACFLKYDIDGTFHTPSWPVYPLSLFIA